MEVEGDAGYLLVLLGVIRSPEVPLWSIGSLWVSLRADSLSLSKHACAGHTRPAAAVCWPTDLCPHDNNMRGHFLCLLLTFLSSKELLPPASSSDATAVSLYRFDYLFLYLHDLLTLFIHLTHTHPHPHSHAHTHKHAQTYIDTHTHTHTHMHTHTNTHVHT